LKLLDGLTGLPARWPMGFRCDGAFPVRALMMLLVFYIILGMFLDGISSVVLTMAWSNLWCRGGDDSFVRIFVIVGGGDGADHAPIGFKPLCAPGHDGARDGYIAARPCRCRGSCADVLCADLVPGLAMCSARIDASRAYERLRQRKPVSGGSVVADHLSVVLYSA
jgi:hypothetical protein